MPRAGAELVSAWVFYVDALFGIRPSGLGNWGIALIGLRVPAVVNLAGVRQMAWFQNLTARLTYLVSQRRRVQGGHWPGT